MTLRRLLVVGGILLVGGTTMLVFLLVDRTEEPRRTVAAGLRGFGEVAVRVIDASAKVHTGCLYAARTDAQHQRGLMEVRDRTLDGRDGMVFLFEEPTRNGFWMRNTPMPLSIAYIDGAGRVVSIHDMTPCADSPNCPSYPPAGPYRSAVETPRGQLARLGIAAGSRLRFGGPC